MSFKSHLKLILRHLPLVIGVTALTLLIAVSFGQNMLKSGYNVTIFTTIGLKRDITTPHLSTSYDDVRAADHFTETVQGWFKNQAFLKKINSYAPESNFNEFIGISAERQEKQNLVINFFSREEKHIDIVSKSIISTLSAEIERFNRTSEIDFQLSLYDTDYAPSSSRLPYLLIFALALGLSFGLGLSYLCEFFGNKALSTEQVENTLHKKADEIIQSRFYGKSSFAYFNALLKKHGGKKIVFVLTWPKADKLLPRVNKAVEKKEIKFINFTESPENITEDHKTLYILTARLGKSKITDILKTSSLINGDYILLIQE